MEPLQAPTPPFDARRYEPMFGEYVVYVDESGDHSLTSIDDSYPVFVLAFCVFHKREYGERVIPMVESLKFEYFGHDNVVLHEMDIRKQKGAFTFLNHRPMREEFLSRLSCLMREASYNVISCVVDKRKLVHSAVRASNPYHLALDVCMRQLLEFLKEKGQQRRLTHVVFECRGKKEDRELALEFQRVAAKLGGTVPPFTAVFADKKTNLSGLQFADLIARPLGLHYLRPLQPNQAFQILLPKLFARPKDLRPRTYPERTGTRPGTASEEQPSLAFQYLRESVARQMRPILQAFGLPEDYGLRSPQESGQPPRSKD